MEHRIYDCRYIRELYCVLDHAWRNPKPKYLGGDTPPGYTNENFIHTALGQQLKARQEVIDFRKQRIPPGRPSQNHPNTVPNNPFASTEYADN